MRITKEELIAARDYADKRATVNGYAVQALLDADGVWLQDTTARYVSYSDVIANTPRKPHTGLAVYIAYVTRPHGGIAIVRPASGPSCAHYLDDWRDHAERSGRIAMNMLDGPDKDEALALQALARIAGTVRQLAWLAEDARVSL